MAYMLTLGTEGPNALFIERPTVAAAWFLNRFEYYKRRSVRVTADNFDMYFKPTEPEQLELPFYQSEQK